MAKTQPTGKQLKDATVERDDLNVAGAAGTTVIAKIVQGNGIIISSTGTDAGTGDVTINTQIYQGATSGAAGARGDVPAAAAGQQNYFLRGDGTWVVAPGTGTVTTVSIVTANGVSGTVATATTTPAITLVLGDIAPTSVSSSGLVKINAANTGFKGQLTLVDPSAVGSSTSGTVAITAYGNDYAPGNAVGRRWYMGSWTGTDNDFWLINTNNANIILGTNGSERMRVLASGGVNIGGSSDPGIATLWITANATTPSVLRLSNLAGSGEGARLEWFSGLGSKVTGKIWSSGDNQVGGTGGGNFQIQTSDPTTGTLTGRLFIGPSGGIVIGTSTTDPGATNLSVAGAIREVTGEAWTAYTPTLGEGGGGAFTSASATGRYRKLGKTVFVQITITITTNGPANTNVTATLPFTAAAFAQVMSAVNDTANLCYAYIVASDTIMHISTYNGLYPGGTGNHITVTGVYEAA